jgi:acyl-coenzyme A thioesterase PaaI-like protein
MGELADAVRRLIRLAVTTEVPGDVVSLIASDLQALGDRLEAGIGANPYPRFLGQDTSEPHDGIAMGSSMPFDVVCGRYNPVAPPLLLEAAPPNAIGRVTYTTPYEGAPGCVHGAALAGAFDIVLTAANMLEGAAGPTVRLALRFRRPTLIDQECVFEGWVDRRTDRRIHTSGRLLQNGEVTVEAEGEFAPLNREEIAGLHRRHQDAP